MDRQQTKQNTLYPKAEQNKSPLVLWNCKVTRNGL